MAASSSSSSTLSLSPTRWDASHMPRQTGRIAIVTGANSGIGFITARELARKGAHVVLACRTESKGQQAVKHIQQEISATDHDEAVGQVEFMQLDVSSLASVHTFAESFRAKFGRLDLLINNAGIMAEPYAVTLDGYEKQFATNHLGHFALTSLLFDLLKQSRAARVVNVSSNAHRIAKLDLDEIMTPEHKYWPMPAYSNSKLCNILFTLELARRLQAQKLSHVMSVAAHPGLTRTNLMGVTAENPSWIVRTLFHLFTYLPIFQSADMGALPTLYAATAPAVQSGQYFGPKGFLANWGFMTHWGYPALEIPGNDSYSQSAATKLWSVSEQLAKLRFQVE